MISAEQFNQRGIGKLPRHLGIVVTVASPAQMCAELLVQPQLMASNGFLRAGSVATVGDRPKIYTW